VLTFLKNLIIRNFTLEKLRALLYSIGGRRFLLTLIVQGSATYLMWYAKITPETYRDIVIGTSGIFIAGNTFQKKLEAPKPQE
jgi:hypothetical protein